MFNTAKEIAEVEKRKNLRMPLFPKQWAQISGAVVENPGNFSNQIIEGKTQQIN